MKKTSIVLNRASFTVATNRKRTEAEFIEKWMPIVWMDLKPSDKEVALKEAYRLVIEAANAPDVPIESAVLQMVGEQAPDSNATPVGDLAETGKPLDTGKPSEKQNNKGGK